MRGCKTRQENLKAYQDGELSLLQRIGVRLHLARCASCREELKVMQEVSEKLHWTEEGGLDPALRARILASVTYRTHDPAEPSSEPARPRFRRRPLIVWGAAAAGVLIGLVYRLYLFPAPSLSTNETKAISNMPAATGPSPAANSTPSFSAGRAGFGAGGGEDMKKKTMQSLPEKPEQQDAILSQKESSADKTVKAANPATVSEPRAQSAGKDNAPINSKSASGASFGSRQFRNYIQDYDEAQSTINGMETNNSAQKIQDGHAKTVLQNSAASRPRLGKSRSTQQGAQAKPQPETPPQSSRRASQSEKKR